MGQRSLGAGAEGEVRGVKVGWGGLGVGKWWERGSREPLARFRRPRDHAWAWPKAEGGMETDGDGWGQAGIGDVCKVCKYKPEHSHAKCACRRAHSHPWSGVLA